MTSARELRDRLDKIETRMNKVQLPRGNASGADLSRAEFRTYIAYKKLQELKRRQIDLTQKATREHRRQYVKKRGMLVILFLLFMSGTIITLDSLDDTLKNQSSRTGSITGAAIGVPSQVRVQVDIVQNPSFETEFTTEWNISKTNADMTAARSSPTYYTPTNGSYALVIGSDTSNGAGALLTTTAGQYVQVAQSDVNITGQSQLLFDTKYEAYYSNPSYFTIQLRIDSDVVWSHDNSDYVADNVSVDLTAYTGIHNITFRLVSNFDGQIYQPGWYVDNMRLLHKPVLSQMTLTPYPLLAVNSSVAQVKYLDPLDHNGSVQFNWYVSGINVFNTTTQNVANGSNVTSNLSSGNYTLFDTVNVTVVAFDGSVYSDPVWSNTHEVGNGAISNPSFENTPVRWTSTKNNTDFEASRLVPSYFTPTHGTYAYVLGTDSSSGYGTVLWSATPDQMIQIKQQNIDFTNGVQFLFDTEYKDYYGVPSYMNISILFDDTVVWSRDSTDYIQSNVAIDVSSLQGFHNITFRLTNKFTGAIAQPAWYIDNLRLVKLPTHNAPILNSTLRTNTTAENLTLWNISTSDPNGDNVKNIYEWTVNGSNIQALLLPFEANSTNAWTKDYITNDSMQTVTGVTWNATGGYDGKGAYDFCASGCRIRTNTVSINYNFSVTAWVNSDVAFQSQFSRIIENDYANGFLLGSGNNANTYQLIVNGAAQPFPYGSVEGGTITVGKWQFISATYNGTHGCLYIDGVQNICGTFPAPTVMNDDLWIGEYSGGGYGWDGKIDEVTIWNRSLSPDQILALYENKTNLIHNSTLTIGDVWSGCITPNDGMNDGVKKCSNNVSIIEASVGNSAPTLTSLTITPTTAYKNSTVSVNISYTDDNNDIGTVYFRWYINSTINIYNQTNNTVSNGTSIQSTLMGGNFSHFDNVTVVAYAFDGTVNSTSLTSNMVQVQNFVPSMVNLLALNGTSIINRTPQLTWNNTFDLDNNTDTITYHLLIDDNSAFNNPEVNVSLIAQGSPNTSTNTTTELDVDKTFFWKVRSFDGFNYSNDSATFNFTLDSYLAVNILRNKINFSVLAPGAKGNTTNESYSPFLLENVGNINSNLTITASNYFFTAVNASSLYYQFNVEQNESNSFNITASQTSWANISLTSLIAHAIDWNYHHWKNDIIVNLLVLVPSNETSGNKNSTVTFTIS